MIPAECYERPASRAAVALVQAAVLYVAPVVALALTDTWWLLPILWLLAGLGVAGLFVLGHDASHGALVESRRANRIIARFCMAPSAHVEAAWDLGHNRVHHGYTTRQGFDFVWHPLTVDDYRALGWFGRLRHRVEWSFLGSGAYYAHSVWLGKMWAFRGGGRRQGTIDRDKAVVASVLAGAIAIAAVVGAFTGGWVTAVWLPVKLFVIPLAVFLNIIGWTVYVHHVADDIRWWPKREWSQFRGQMESTTVLHLPRLVNRLWMHNIMVHVPHHVDTRLPFHQLPRAATAIAAAFPDTIHESNDAFRRFWRSTRTCKLHDFDEGVWLPYSAARA
ncbi:MAG: fatty acid desaturase [Actinomycetota bacterium]